MKNSRRYIAIVLTLVVAFTLVSCVGKPPAGEVAGKGKLFNKPATISIMMPSSSNSKYNADWVAWKYVREAIGADIKIQAIPADYETKISLAFTSRETLPDLIVLDNKPFADHYAEQGAIIAIDDYMDIMPNYKAFWNSVDKKERETLLMYRKSADGKTYYPQKYGSHDTCNLKTWMYRKDIFEKNNLKNPETTDDLYNVAVKLKKLYPDSYPICIRNFFQNGVNTFGPSWKPYYTWDVYYDFDTKTWHYGSRENTMLEIIKYFKKLYDERLIPPSFVKMNAAEWKELVSNNKTFVFPQYNIQIDLLNKANQELNPEFTMAPMVPPRANNGVGVNKLYKYNVDPTGYIICNTGKKDQIKNAIRFVDWCYSDEACELLSWGKEGETYEVVNGNKQFILNDNEDISNKYGLQTYGLSQRLKKEAVLSFYSETTRKNIEVVVGYIEDKFNPAQWLGLTSDELLVKKDVGASVDTYSQEMISKFLLGQEPLSKWDSFIKNLNDMGVDKLLAVYKSAYDRVQ